MRRCNSAETRNGKAVTHAGQELEREEREAVRGVEGQGHVEGARGEDRQLAGRVEPWREELGVLELGVVAGRYHRPEEGGRPQGRKGNRPEELAAPAGAPAGTGRQ